MVIGESIKTFLVLCHHSWSHNRHQESKASDRHSWSHNRHQELVASGHHSWSHNRHQESKASGRHSWSHNRHQELVASGHRCWSHDCHQDSEASGRHSWSPPLSRVSRQWLKNMVSWNNACQCMHVMDLPTTVKPRYTGPKSNENPPITNAKSWSLQVIPFYFCIGNNRNPPITDEICWSLDVRYCGASL